MALTILITNAGRAALLNADKSGTRAVRIAAVGVSPTAITPAAIATTLPGEIKRITTLSGDQVAADMIHLVVRDEGDAVYSVRSFALYLDDGTLFAIYGQADVIVEKSAQALLLLAVDVVLKDIAASSITFGNTNFLLPPATTERQGLVELATDAEAAAMLDAVRALTPRGASLILTAANILSRLLTVDGAGSGLDADLVRGRVIPQGAWLGQSGIAPANVDPDSLQVGGSAFSLHASLPVTGTVCYVAALAGGDVSDRGLLLASPYATGDLYMRSRPAGWIKLWSATNDGAGSGLDADLLDGQDSSFYSNIVARLGYTPVQMGTGSGQLTNIVKMGWSGTRLKVTVDTTDQGNVVFDGHIADVWRSSNDGAGSGLDADLLDGRQASDFALLSGATFTGNVDARDLTASRGDGTGVIFLNGDKTRHLFCGPGGYDLPRAGLTINGGTAWSAVNDGAGSGLDSDLLDGWHADDLRRWGNLLDRPGSYPPSAHSHGAADIAGAFSNASHQANGYQVLPGGLILQWVTGPYQSAGTEASVFVRWPITFPNACFQAFPSTQIDAATDRGDSWFQLVGDPATDGCTVFRQRSGNPNDSAATAPKIFAIGR